MKITIWSDFVCPFCYIGEANLRHAMESFDGSDEVEIEYKSFQLDPTGKHVPELNYNQTLSKLKGMPLEQAEKMMERVQTMAQEAGLPIQFDKAVYANTLDAHRVFQLAKEKGLGNEFYKRLYLAHFNEGINLEDAAIIEELSVEIGLNREEVREVLTNKELNKQVVQKDVSVAASIGVQGVPFFVFDNKYAVSGAQPVEIFSNVLTQTAAESV